jgi:hypothetical protein
MLRLRRRNTQQPQSGCEVETTRSGDLLDIPNTNDCEVIAKKIIAFGKKRMICHNRVIVIVTADIDVEQRVLVLRSVATLSLSDESFVLGQSGCSNDPTVRFNGSFPFTRVPKPRTK